MSSARPAPTQTDARTVARRPHAERRVATVTRLMPPTTHRPDDGAEQGALALGLDPQPGMPGVPELSLVRGGRPDLERWAARFVQAAVEVITGDRSPTQLVRSTSPRVHLEISRRARVITRTTSPAKRRRTARVQVRSVHVFCPAPDVAEAAVHLRHGERGRAVALRLEIRDDRWQCVAIQFG